MYAMGHQQTLPPYFRMSAYPQKRTSPSVVGTSALCQYATLARLHNHLIGTRLQRQWHGEAERLRGLEVVQLELGRLLHGKSMTIGSDDVARCNAAVPAALTPITTSGASEISSFAKTGSLANSPSARLTSRLRFRPTT